MADDLITKLTAHIVAAYLKHNELPPEQVALVIKQVHDSLARLNSVDAVLAQPKLTPAVPIRRSVTADEIFCLDCGFKAKMLKRHLMTAHNIGPEAYRKRWGLPDDYALVARGYSERRSTLAKEIGLGRLRGKHRRAPAPAETAPPPPAPATSRRGRPRRAPAPAA